MILYTMIILYVYDYTILFIVIENNMAFKKNSTSLSYFFGILLSIKFVLQGTLAEDVLEKQFIFQMLHLFGTIVYDV